MQVVNALEFILHLCVVELYHLNELVDRLLCLLALQEDAKLPLASFYPEVEAGRAFLRQEVLGLLKGSLGKQ